jgi:16S rRNA (cytosine967-C5)-methyltransferase
VTAPVRNPRSKRGSPTPSKPADARTLAAGLLDALENRDAYADQLLDGLWSRRPDADPRDRALTTHLVYGVLRWRNGLDRVIEHAAERPTGKLSLGVLNLLRVGAYQLLHLDRIPASAAVHATVEATRRRGFSHSAGLVNAVLRRVSAEGKDLPPPEDPILRLALTCGLPVWLAALWTSEEGAEGAACLGGAAATIPPCVLRVDTRKTHRNDVIGRLGKDASGGLCAYAPEGVWTEGGGDPRQIEAVRTGKAVVQSQASQLVAPYLAPPPGARVLDACAAPGLKATHIARLMENRGEVTALEIHPHRARAAEELARRLGFDSIRVVTADATVYRDSAPFDAVLVDAPCSGLGVLAHTPEKKWRYAPADFDRFPPLQRALLENAARAVAPGGTLVYATCTTVRSENEGLIAGFLDDHPEFRRAGPPPGFPAPDLCTREGDLKTFPRPTGGGPDRFLDGFYAARLTRR